MRMRKKHYLAPRLEQCSHLLIDDSKDYRGRWLERYAGKRELWLELGCGKGRFAIKTALQNPDCLIIAIEKIPNVLAPAMERVCNAGVGNARFICCDANMLNEFFAENEVKFHGQGKNISRLAAKKEERENEANFMERQRA